MRKKFLTIIVLAGLCLPGLSVLAQATPSYSVKVSGEVTTPLTLTAADLTAMPRPTGVGKDKQGVPHTFAGVAIADILNKAGVTTGRQLKGENLAKYLLVTCADNY